MPHPPAPLAASCERAGTHQRPVVGSELTAQRAACDGLKSRQSARQHRSSDRAPVAGMRSAGLVIFQTERCNSASVAGLRFVGLTAMRKDDMGRTERGTFMWELRAPGYWRGPAVVVCRILCRSTDAIPQMLICGECACDFKGVIYQILCASMDILSSYVQQHGHQRQVVGFTSTPASSILLWIDRSDSL